MSERSLRRFLQTITLVAASMAPATLRAHVYPISYGTLELIQGAAKLRMRISAHNLHPALETFTGGHLEMKDGGYELSLLDAYFKGRLELVSPKGKVVGFRIVEQAIGTEEIVLSLEAPAELPKASKGWRLRNTVLFEQSRNQKNYITIEQGGKRRGLIFDAQHPLLPLSAP